MKSYLLNFVIIFTFLSFYGFSQEIPRTINPDIKLTGVKDITTNKSNSGKVFELTNIKEGYNYVQSFKSTFFITPALSILQNRNNTSLQITIPDLGYSKTVNLSENGTGLNHFSEIEIERGKTYFVSIKAFDENQIIIQKEEFNFVFYSGVRRFPLYEEVTNAYCGPCATSNPILNNYLHTMKDSIVAVIYHSWWPGINDPMYQHNINQNRDRIQYMAGNVNATPWLNVDGIIVDVWPFTLPNLSGAFNQRMAIATPVDLRVTHNRFSQDSVEAIVTLNIISPLPSGNYKLRVYAVEDPIIYATPPGNNGERDFPHVFRKALPNSTGDVIPTVPGTYYFTYRYSFESAWVDTALHTIALVQNDNNKEVLNSTSSKFQTIVPVELSHFSAIQSGNSILVQWETTTELNNLGFEIQKSYDGINFTTAGFVNGKGNSLLLASYQFRMTELNQGKIHIRLKQLDFDGTFAYSNVIQVDFQSLPETFTLNNSYPNPFNPSTNITFGIPYESEISLGVYSITGELVASIHNGTIKAGTHTIRFDASNLNSGVYVVVLKSEEGVKSIKTTLLK
ncbi:MAG: Omp28-related outer membrane protein [Ignavibacteriaceae bacterium]|nr:Omp28-related outer membrane protein [Ignavibacteriaceae bacterium]